jgi:hypothetical protein
MVATQSGETNTTFYFEIINRSSTQIDTNGFSQMNGLWLGYMDVTDELRQVAIDTAYGSTGEVRVVRLGKATSSVWTISTIYDEID